jgi:hypothetical protein
MGQKYMTLLKRIANGALSNTSNPYNSN